MKRDEPVETTDRYDQARERRRYWAHQLVKMKLHRQHGTHVTRIPLGDKRTQVTFAIHVNGPGRFRCVHCGVTSDYEEEVREGLCQECGGWEPDYAG